MILKQLNLFFIALGFLTRIPVPAFVNYSQEGLNQACRYFSLVGWLVGFIGAATFWLMNNFFPLEIAVITSMLSTILITGCFHEDGLADSCDGLGGGWKVEQKLIIMKDSRLGTYGATGLWFVLMLKFLLLSNLDNVVIAIIIAHPLSRTLSTIMMYKLPYVTDNQHSKVKPLAKAHRSSDLIINCCIGLIVLFISQSHIFILIVGLTILMTLLGYFFFRQIKGITGDILGATQQISEIFIYLFLLIPGSL